MSKKGHVIPADVKAQILDRVKQEDKSVEPISKIKGINPRSSPGPTGFARVETRQAAGY